MTTRWTDDNGKTWDAKFAIGTANRLRTSLNANLLNQKTLERYWTDPYFAVELIVEVHRKKFESAGISEEDFSDMVTSSESVALAAYDAMSAALANFLRVMKQAALADLVEGSTKAAKKAEAEAAAMVRKDLDAIVEKAVSKATNTVSEAINRAKS